MQVDLTDVPALYRHVNKQLSDRFASEQPRLCVRVAKRIWIAENRPRPKQARPGKIMQGLGLYGRLVRARLTECYKAKPNMALVRQQSRWMQMLEDAAERRHREGACG
jgi:hypothetical protein